MPLSASPTWLLPGAWPDVSRVRARSFAGTWSQAGVVADGEQSLQRLALRPPSPPPCDTLVTVGVALSRKGRGRLTGGETAVCGKPLPLCASGGWQRWTGAGDLDGAHS